MDPMTALAIRLVIAWHALVAGLVTLAAMIPF